MKVLVPETADLVRALASCRAPAVLPRAFFRAHVGERWRADRLAAVLRGREVALEYSLFPVYRPRPELQDGGYFRKVVPFDEALSRIAAQHEHRTWAYLSSVPLTRDAPECAELLPRLAALGRRALREVALFIGPSGSGTHLHYDSTDNLLVALEGRKEIWLCPPSSSRLLRPQRFGTRCSHFSALPVTRDGSLVWPAGVQIERVTLEPGDGLFFPAGWWHFVRNDGYAVSATWIWPARRRALLDPMQLRLRASLRLAEAWTR